MPAGPVHDRTLVPLTFEPVRLTVGAENAQLRLDASSFSDRDTVPVNPSRPVTVRVGPGAPETDVTVRLSAEIVKSVIV